MKDRGVGVGKGVMEDVRLKLSVHVYLRVFTQGKECWNVCKSQTLSQATTHWLYASLKAETGFYSSWCSLSQAPHKGHERG